NDLLAFLCVGGLLFTLFTSLLLAETIEVKQDGTGNFTFIQEGINASVDSDTVLVYPGTYFENIDFIGKNITVASLLLTNGDESYIDSTIIDGNQQGSVITFENNETNNAVLIGLTLQNGSGQQPTIFKYGGGIFINFSSPSLKYLKIINNNASTGGGILFSSSNAYLEAVIIKKNHAFAVGGGITIGRLPPNPINSNITFSSINKCNIYNNSAGYYSDISIAENHAPVTNVIVDTLTVLYPDHNFTSQFPNISLSIEHAWLEQVEHDIYVSPDGDDNNSGLTIDEPLRTIQWALTKIKADSLNPRNIYIAEGIYSPASNNELFPLNMRSYVSIIGAGVEETIFEEPIGKAAFIYGWHDNFIKLSSFTARNRTGANISPSPIQLSFSNSELSDILIENCFCMNASAIGSTGDIIIKDVKIYNNNGMKAVVCGSYPDQEITAKLNNVIFIGNDQYEPTCGGGALSVSCRKSVSLKNCLFAKNHAYDNVWPNANIYLLENDTVDFFNNIVCNNTSNGGAIAVGGGGTINIKNSIIYGNSNYQFQTKRGYEPSYVNVSHSLIQGGTDPSILHIAGPEPYGVEFIWGEGIIDEIPQFLGGDEYDPLYYQLTELSPCIDAGTPDTTGLYLPPWDLLHNYRVWDGDNNGTAIIDMGCYEFGAEQYVEAENIQSSIFNIQLSNYPNPFNPETKIVFNLPEEGNVKLEIYNIKGQKVKILMDCYTSPGDFELIWNGKDDNNLQVGSGVYFYQLNINGNSEAINKMILLK
ncbi:MAG: T9SS type A sorting domain-containing protein, partial [Armatimonadetes bacterium]|nr:T9SS type A sorting domain-containing protein [Armatimonadota bacterium]